MSGDEDDDYPSEAELRTPCGSIEKARPNASEAPKGSDRRKDDLQERLRRAEERVQALEARKASSAEAEFVPKKRSQKKRPPPDFQEKEKTLVKKGVARENSVRCNKRVAGNDRITRTMSGYSRDDEDNYYYDADMVKLKATHVPPTHAKSRPPVEKAAMSRPPVEKALMSRPERAWQGGARVNESWDDAEASYREKKTAPAYPMEERRGDGARSERPEFGATMSRRPPPRPVNRHDWPGAHMSAPASRRPPQPRKEEVRAPHWDDTVTTVPESRSERPAPEVKAAGAGKQATQQRYPRSQSDGGEVSKQETMRNFVKHFVSGNRCGPRRVGQTNSDVGQKYMQRAITRRLNEAIEKRIKREEERDGDGGPIGKTYSKVLKSMGKTVSRRPGSDDEDEIAQSITANFWYPPIFVSCQLLTTVASWLYFSSKSGGDDFYKAQGGLDDLWPGKTGLTLAANCVDTRAELWRLISYQYTHSNCLQIGHAAAMLIFFGYGLERFHGFIRMFIIFNMGVVGAGFSCCVANPAHYQIGMNGGCSSLLAMDLGATLMNFSSVEYRWGTLVVILLNIVFDIGIVVMTKAAASESLTVQFSCAINVGGYLAGFLSSLVFARNMTWSWREGFCQCAGILVFIALLLFCIGRMMLWPQASILTPEDYTCWYRELELTEEMRLDFGFVGNSSDCVRCFSRACIERFSKVNGTIRSAYECKEMFNGKWAFSEV